MPLPQYTLDEHTVEWQEGLNGFPAELRQQTALLAEQHKTELATQFYTAMLAHREAALFLSHEEVKTRLSKSMEAWIVNLYASHDAADIQSVIAHQRKIGEVHARISIPVHLVLRGARLLKQRFIEVLHAELPLDQATLASSFSVMLVDLAMEIMSHAYSASNDRNSRAEESYRMFAVAQNIASEREKQRAALLDWENQVMFDIATDLKADQLPRLSASEFGLWFRHKGAHGFEGAPESKLIFDTIVQVDEVLLPLFTQRLTSGHSQQSLQFLRDLREKTRSIAYHLDLLFEQNNELEAGRDVLTRLLNRKYLSVVLNKQIAYTRTAKEGFAALSIDVDHFKQINDNYGHEAGDMMLQQFALLLLNKSRAGDYLFRMGGEEFLIILVDVNDSNAARAAENIRQQIAEETFRLPHDGKIHVTASVGLAMFNGHPDYQQLLRRSDAALYEAKRGGRNRVVIAPS